MTSANILPTFGPALPNIRRIPLPRDLQQQAPQPVQGPIAARAEAESRRLPETGGAVAAAPQKREPEPFPLPENLAGAAAVTVQVNESTASQPRAEIPQVLPNDNLPITSSSSTNDAGEGGGLSSQLSEEEEAYVRELQAIDREVRAHEAAHANTGGGFAGRPSYEYVTGPDGRRYAVSGSVQIDTRAVEGDPAATIRKLETVRRAALAPAQPSGQDRAVAAQAAASIRQAEAELSEQRAKETEELLGGEEVENPNSLFDTRDGDEGLAEADNGDGLATNARNKQAEKAFAQADLLSASLPDDAVSETSARFSVIA